jgi:hypothetical protein
MCRQKENKFWKGNQILKFWKNDLKLVRELKVWYTAVILLFMMQEKYKSYTQVRKIEPTLRMLSQFFS